MVALLALLVDPPLLVVLVVVVVVDPSGSTVVEVLEVLTALVLLGPVVVAFDEVVEVGVTDDVFWVTVPIRGAYSENLACPSASMSPVK